MGKRHGERSDRQFGVGDENEGGAGGRREAQKDLRQLRKGGKGSPVRDGTAHVVEIT